MAKKFTACNWARSRVTEDQLNEMVSIGSLPKKTEIKWRVLGTENPPTPRQGKVVIFVDHIGCGFKPPGSKFYRDVLASFQLHPQDIGPNSVSNLCNLQVFCEVYLQEEPTGELFRDFFHLNLVVSLFKSGRKLNSFMPNCTVTLRNGTRLGSTA